MLQKKRVGKAKGNGTIFACRFIERDSIILEDWSAFLHWHISSKKVLCLWRYRHFCVTQTRIQFSRKAKIPCKAMLNTKELFFSRFLPLRIPWKSNRTKTRQRIKPLQPPCNPNGYKGYLQSQLRSAKAKGESGRMEERFTKASYQK